MRKKVICVLNNSQIIGVFTNLKMVWEKIDRATLPHYATVASYLRNGFPYNVGTCRIDGQIFENVTLRQCPLNTLNVSAR